MTFINYRQIVYLNMNIYSAAIKQTKYDRTDRQWENMMNELINPFDTVTKQTKWIRTDKEYTFMNDPFSPVIKQTKWAQKQIYEELPSNNH